MIDPRLPYDTTVRTLAGLFLLELAILAIAPISRGAWLLENLLVFALARAHSYARIDTSGSLASRTR